jgi:hypothetical protein
MPPPIQMPLARTGDNNNRCMVFLSFFDDNSFVTTFWNDATRWAWLFLWGVTLPRIMGATALRKAGKWKEPGLSVVGVIPHGQGPAHRVMYRLQ